jgi:lipopolysaccharide biosynthesis regulator YciM
VVIKALHLLLLPIAATFGWYVGKRDRVASQVSHQLRRDYFQGLSYLINDQSDQAVDVFIKLSEVDSDTAEIHLALGYLFRQRGEVDRAIRIHQNLLARPELDKRYHVQALFALGQDYFRAGVLDRAEQIFLELAALKEDWNEERQNSLNFLLRIYQQEKAWLKAIDITRKISAQTGETTDTVMAQFCCELAEQEAGKGQFARALEHLHQAISTDPHCVRANLIAGRLAYQTKHYAEAIRHYQNVKVQDIHFIPEIISPLCQCYHELGKEEDLIEYLQKCLQEFPNIFLVLTVANYLQRLRGEQTAIEFIAQHIKNDASLRGLNHLITSYLQTSQDKPAAKLTLLKGIIQQLAENKSTYRCVHCGFSAPMLSWSCPSCHQWTTIRPMQGLAARAV